MNLVLSDDASLPLYQRLYNTLRSAILAKDLPAGSLLPASRALSLVLKVSRNTVLSAYDMLKAEGYVESVQGSGLYVCAQLPEHSHLAPQLPVTKTSTAALSQRGERLARNSRPVPTLENPAFVPGLPDLAEFPHAHWNQCVTRHSRLINRNLMRYRDDGGLPELKRALRNYLKLSRGVNCEPEQIIIVNGSQAGLDLITRLLLDSGESVAIEEPGYLGAVDGFLAAGAKLQPVPVDDNGINTEWLAEHIQQRAHNQQAPLKLVYTTPSNQFPLGCMLSAQRRLSLLDLASEHNFLIIEDDYDSEFRFDQRTISSLQGLDREQRVVYMGTFSKVMFPGLRMGYLVVPESLAKGFAFALRKTGQDTPALLQAAMASFIEEGYFASHLRKMRKLYGEKQKQFVAQLHTHTHPWLEVIPNYAGMQLACRFKVPMNTERLITEARNAALNVTLLNRYYQTNAAQQGLYLGYAGVPLVGVEKSVKQLAAILAVAAE